MRNIYVIRRKKGLSNIPVKPEQFWRHMNRIYGKAEVRAEAISRPEPPSPKQSEWQQELPL